jgi:hypothetical protein
VVPGRRHDQVRRLPSCLHRKDLKNTRACRPTPVERVARAMNTV